MQDSVAEWIEISDYDLATAEAMLDSGRYLYVLFCCQQAIEKRLKALIVKRTQQMPARTHDLLRLASDAKIELSSEQEFFLRRLGQYYIETRYPEELWELAKRAGRDLAESYLTKTQEAIAWFDQTLKSN